jgi:C4-type Zn-finger protein
MRDYDYDFPENTNYVMYGEMMFLRRCPTCMRFVKADNTLPYFENVLTEEKRFEPNATCKKCGRVEMDFLGYI